MLIQFDFLIYIYRDYRRLELLQRVKNIVSKENNKLLLNI
jgi:hypothetical protein